MAWIWIVYILAALAGSVVVGRHLGKFGEAYTEMTGMMAGMTMGMLNGFLVGYGAAAATASMFWGNLVGILVGLAMGFYFGRAGGLMGVMDGSMGGVMGGSMGAMLAAMLFFPTWGMNLTGILLVPIYIVGMIGLLALIEQSAPEQGAAHRILPLFARWMPAQATEGAAKKLTQTQVATALKIPDYYDLLGVQPTANQDQIADAYLARLATAGQASIQQLELALATLTDPARREVYDGRLQESQATLRGPDGRPACCPPKKKKAVAQADATQQATSTTAVTTRAAVAPTPATAPRPARSQQKKQAPKQKEAPISWVGGVAAIFIVAMLVGWWLANSGASITGAGATTASAVGQALKPSAELAAQLEAQATVAQVSADGKQTLDVVVNGTTRSYRPSVIKVKKGTPVHFNLTTEGRDPGCGRFVGVRGLGVHGVAEPGKVAPMDFTPSQSGVFEINCSMNMMTPGYLIVSD